MLIHLQTEEAPTLLPEAQVDQQQREVLVLQEAQQEVLLQEEARPLPLAETVPTHLHQEVHLLQDHLLQEVHQQEVPLAEVVLEVLQHHLEEEVNKTLISL
ncbi:hypothetical protein BTO14_15045 [Polaribacter butkevichii]|uniref:Uncharacterized protein n=1 Tax=Polaribacter butkevichii TaxID=218490 RepID=A0A2P6C8T0_9FLAO|nr:hypothetical protein BTO14_15045 [Polaribacter butkevichii]